MPMLNVSFKFKNNQLNQPHHESLTAKTLASQPYESQIPNNTKASLKQLFTFSVDQMRKLPNLLLDDFYAIDEFMQGK